MKWIQYVNVIFQLDGYQGRPCRSNILSGRQDCLLLKTQQCHQLVQTTFIILVPLLMISTFKKYGTSCSDWVNHNKIIGIKKIIILWVSVITFIPNMNFYPLQLHSNNQMYILLGSELSPATNCKANQKWICKQPSKSQEYWYNYNYFCRSHIYWYAYNGLIFCNMILLLFTLANILNIFLTWSTTYESVSSTNARSLDFFTF